MSDLKLDLLVIDTHNPLTLGIGDLSSYPQGFAIVSPSISITPPNFPLVTLDFTDKQINIYDSLNLKITCEGQDKVKLPDGIYILKYSIAPAYQNFVEKTFFKVDNIMEDFDTAFLKNDITICDTKLEEKNRRFLEEIEFYINYAIASANRCANSTAKESYAKAKKLLSLYNKC